MCIRDSHHLDQKLFINCKIILFRNNPRKLTHLDHHQSITISRQIVSEDLYWNISIYSLLEYWYVDWFTVSKDDNFQLRCK